MHACCDLHHHTTAAMAMLCLAAARDMPGATTAWLGWRMEADVGDQTEPATVPFTPSYTHLPVYNSMHCLPACLAIALCHACLARFVTHCLPPCLCFPCCICMHCMATGGLVEAEDNQTGMVPSGLFVEEEGEGD